MQYNMNKDKEENHLYCDFEVYLKAIKNRLKSSLQGQYMLNRSPTNQRFLKRYLICVINIRTHW
jgi:hypothetical protein